MHRLATLATFTAATLIIPSIAVAAPITDISPGATGLVTALTAMLTAGTALIAAFRSVRRARHAEERAEAADTRSSQALAWTDRLANAHSDGVVLILSYPGTAVSCRGLLEINGWRLQYYQVTQEELDRGALLPGPDMLNDVRAADAIVIEGLDESHMATLAGMRDFRDRIRSGAGVALYTAGRNLRYDLTLWGECDQGVTMPVTTEAAVRASLARREATARRQGIRPGQMAEARAQPRTLINKEIRDDDG